MDFTKFVSYDRMPDTDDIYNAVITNDGYCPCSVERTNTTSCPCRDFRLSQVGTVCTCGLFKKKMLDYIIYANSYDIIDDLVETDHSRICDLIALINERNEQYTVNTLQVGDISRMVGAFVLSHGLPILIAKSGYMYTVDDAIALLEFKGSVL